MSRNIDKIFIIPSNFVRVESRVSKNKKCVRFMDLVRMDPFRDIVTLRQTIESVKRLLRLRRSQLLKAKKKPRTKILLLAEFHLQNSEYLEAA